MLGCGISFLIVTYVLSSEELYSNDLVLYAQRNTIYARVDAALHLIRATSEVRLYLG